MESVIVELNQLKKDIGKLETFISYIDAIDKEYIKIKNKRCDCCNQLNYNNHGVLNKYLYSIKDAFYSTLEKEDFKIVDNKVIDINIVRDFKNRIIKLGKSLEDKYFNLNKKPLCYNPFTGEKIKDLTTINPQDLRLKNSKVAWLYSGYTGMLRNAESVGEDLFAINFDEKIL
jgi:hypothetical protein